MTRYTLGVLFFWALMVLGLSWLTQVKGARETAELNRAEDSLAKDIESLQVIYDINEGHYDSNKAALQGHTNTHSALSQR